MESVAYDSQLYPSNEANDCRDPFEAFMDFTTYDTQDKNGGQNGSLSVSLSSIHDASSSTCLRGFKDIDGFDMICFCIQCQDVFLAQEVYSDSSRSKSLDIASSLEFSPQSTGEVTTDDSASPPSSCSSSRSRGSPKRKRNGSKSSGISKSITSTSKNHPEVLIDQLKVALHGDENASAEFKFKTSILFNELKRLIEAESSSQRLTTTSEPRQIEAPLTAPTCHRKRSQLPKRKASKIQSSEKIFQCTWPTCQYASSSAMDWKRHEETHWPQKRYMCLECASSAADSSKCSYCLYLYPLHTQNDSSEHLLYCESAKRNGRTFARKDKLSEHLQKDHSAPPSSAMSRAATCVFEIDSGWTRQCGFCGILFDTWDERARHLVEDHFKQGADLRTWQPAFPDAWKFSAGPAPDTQNFDSEFCCEPLSQDSYYPPELLSQFAGWEYSRPNPTPSIGIPPVSQPPQGTSELAGSSMYEELEMVKRQLVQPTENALVFDPTIENSTTQESFTKEPPPVEKIRARQPVSKRRRNLLPLGAQAEARRIRQIVPDGQDPKDQMKSQPSKIDPQSYNYEAKILSNKAPSSPSSVISVPCPEGPEREVVDTSPSNAFLPLETQLQPLLFAESGLEQTSSTNKKVEDPHIRHVWNAYVGGHATEAQQAEWINRMAHHPYFTRRRELIDEGHSEIIVDMSEEIRGLRQWMLDDHWDEEFFSKPWQRFSPAEVERLKRTLKEQASQAAELEQLKGRPGEHPYWPRRRQLIYELRGLDTKERIEEIVDQIQEIQDLCRMKDNGDWGEEFSARSRAYFSAAELDQLKRTLRDGKHPTDADLGKVLLKPAAPRSGYILNGMRTEIQRPTAEGQARVVEAAVGTEHIPTTLNTSPESAPTSKEDLEMQQRVTMLKEAMVARKAYSLPRKDQDLVRLMHASRKDVPATPQPKTSIKKWLQKLALPFRPAGNVAQESRPSDQNRASLSSVQAETIQERRKSKVDYETTLSSAMAGMSIAEGSSMASKRSVDVNDGGVGKKSRLGFQLASTTPLLPPIEWEDRPRHHISMDQAAG